MRADHCRRARIVMSYGLFLALLQIGLGCSSKKPNPSPTDPGGRNGGHEDPVKVDSVNTVRVPGEDFEISLLGEGWTLSTQPSPKAANYFRARPTMLVGIYHSTPAETEQAHETNSKRSKDVRKPGSSSELLFESNKTNDHGHPLWWYLTEERQGGRAAFVGVSITWLKKKKTVIMIFEGQYTSASDDDMRRERPLFRQSAERTLRSVK